MTHVAAGPTTGARPPVPQPGAAAEPEQRTGNERCIESAAGGVGNACAASALGGKEANLDKPLGGMLGCSWTYQQSLARDTAGLNR